MAERIALFRPVVSDAAIAAVNDVLRSGWPGPGPVVERFEEEFARFVGAPHAVAVTSGTAALHIGLRLLDLTPGDEVITSPITFIGANQVILYEHATPVFVDVDEHTGNLVAEAVAAAVGPNTKAIITTHLGGTPSDLAELLAIADRAGIALIEDAAHACGATYRGATIGSHSATQTFSFQATKNLTTIDGGMVCLRSADDADRARRLRWMGIDRDTWSRTGATGYDWAYCAGEVGFKYAMNDLTAAMGSAHLATLPAANERRRAIAARYRAGLATAGVTFAPLPTDRTSAVYLCSVLTDQRNEVRSALRMRGIGTGVHYRRNDQHPIFGPPGELPGAEQYWTRTLSLPVHLELTDAQVDEVIAAVREETRHLVAH